MEETSQKQIEANRENGKLGGVKTEEGKAVSKYNALKHGILKEVVSDYEKDFYQDIVQRLEDQFEPVGVLEKMLLDRIGVYYLKLYRVAKAENEYMKSTLDPRVVEIEETFPDLMTRKIVKNEGYIPTIGDDSIKTLSDTYLRYEITIENRLYKALHELQRLQADRNGNGNTPIAIDVDI